MVSWNIGHHELQFRVSQSLFSSQNIDLGSIHLLKTITEVPPRKTGKILDLGCGYGPIGITLKKMYPLSDVHMVDKDALALNYSRQNLTLNNISDVHVYASLGYDDIKDSDFDLIISNVPAKVGKKVLTHILKDARFYLKPGGQMMVVVIDAIGDYVSDELNDPRIHILFTKRWPGYRVFHYEFLPSDEQKEYPQSFATGIYDRDENYISYKGLEFLIKTTYNLPEFDTISYETDVLLTGLLECKDKHYNNVLVFNSGQGYIPVALSKLANIKQLCLIDRDIQAIRISKNNLQLNGYQTSAISILHQVGITTSEDKKMFDCIVGTLDEDDSPSVHAMYLREAANQILSKGLVIFAASSTAITRLESILNKEKLLLVRERKRFKGKSVLVMQAKT